MDGFWIAIKRDPQVQIKIKDILVEYNRLPYKYQSKIGCDTLLQNVIFKEMINLMASTIADLDIELKLKISRIKYLEKRSLWLCNFISIYMTVIYLTEYNTRCYGTIFGNNGCVWVQKFEDISDNEDKVLCVRPLRAFLGKSEACPMRLMSGTLDKSVFDGNTILLIKSEEKDKYR